MRTRTPEQQIQKDSRDRERYARETRSLRQQRRRQARTPEAQDRRAELRGISLQKVLATQAVNALNYAVKKGKILPPEICDECGEVPEPFNDGRRALQAHHHRGYAREHYLDVRWLCIKCHRKERV